VRGETEDHPGHQHPAPSAPLLELRNIRKSFGPVRAVRGADFALVPGEVHALVGENGAGKSTLMHIAYGMIAPDAGSILVDGRTVKLASPRDARALRIGMVHQHFTSIGALSVRENIALGVGRRPLGVGGPPPGGVYERLKAGLAPDARVDTLTVGQRQRLEILKALATGAKILLLDEPTAVLAPAEVDELFALVRELVQAGGAVALITHKLPEVLAASDRVTVLRRGMVTLHGATREQTDQTLALAMIGDEADTRQQATGNRQQATGGSQEATVQIREIELHAGELVGVAAVEGNGHRELLRAIAGLGPLPGIQVAGRVAFVPEDRSTEGLIPAMSITENMVLGLGDDPRWARGTLLDWRAARARTGELIEGFGIVAPGPDVPTGTLSGGNQQKVVLARALERHPALLVLENPTRGLDARTTGEMHRRLREAASAGVTVIVYSTDLDEVLELAERVLVVWKGEVREVPTGADRRAVGEMMLGVEPRDR
jgi:general nucleoside transport system ATP-binding protein